MAKEIKDQDNFGLTLTGVLTASVVETRQARDSKEVYRTRKSVISTKKITFGHTEYHDDLSIDIEAYPVEFQKCKVDVVMAKSSEGKTTVFGTLSFDVSPDISE